jgi:hypothetical protein
MSLNIAVSVARPGLTGTRVFRESLRKAPGLKTRATIKTTACTGDVKRTMQP